MGNNINSQAQFPNIDQLSSNERGMYMKEHEFEASLTTMISELDSLLDVSSSSESAIKNNSSKVQSELNVLIGRIESEIVSLVERYIEQIREEESQVEAAYERLYSKIYNIIQSVNVNIQNRTTTYDIVMSYKLRILDEIEAMFGKTSPYSDGRSISSDERYSIQIPNTLIRLRDVDEGIAWRSIPVIIDPNITQDKTVKICEFTPVRNNTFADAGDNYIPTFLAEIIIAGDLFAFKGILKSVTQNRDARFNKAQNRSAIFVADYFINQDLPFSIKVLYDKNRNKVAVALKYDDTEDKFTSIIKFDFSINLLVGTNLDFANESTCVIMDGAGLNSYNVSIERGNSFIEIGEYSPKVTHNGSVSCFVTPGTNIDLESSFNSGATYIEFRYTNPNGYLFDKKDIASIMIGDSEVTDIVDNKNNITEVIFVEHENGETILKIANPELYAQAGVPVIAKVRLTGRYVVNENTITRYKYSLPDLDVDTTKISVTVNGETLPPANWDFDKNSGLLQINNITGELVCIISADVSATTEEIGEN